MDRRDFIRQVGSGWPRAGPAAGCPGRCHASAAGPKVRLALLADAHLKDGDDRRPEAQALARAVAEISALSPPPDLVLFAGDLAHQGRPDALDLGREILADLPAPCWAVRGEGDHGPGENAAWVRRWGEPRFSRAFRGFQFLGLDTSLTPGPADRSLRSGRPSASGWPGSWPACLPPRPLIILSHAPSGARLSPLAAVDRGRPGSGPAPVPFLPGAVPPRARACGAGLETGVRGQG